MLESCPTQIHPAVLKAGLEGSVPQDGARRALPGRVSPPGWSEVGLARQGQPPGQSEVGLAQQGQPPRTERGGPCLVGSAPQDGARPCHQETGSISQVQLTRARLTGTYCMQVRGPLSLRGGERRLCLPAPADLPTAGRVPHGTGWLLLVTAEALTGGIRAWWTQAGKPTRVLQPR